MSKERGNGGTAADRFAGLLAWWGMADPSKAGPYEAQLKRLQGFLSELQSVYGEAYGRQMEALFAANEHFAQAAQDLMKSRQPADVVAAETALMSALMEEASAQALSWAQLVEKLTGCCAAAATGEPAGPAPQAKAPADAPEGDAPAQPRPARAGKTLRAV